MTVKKTRGIGLGNARCHLFIHLSITVILLSLSCSVPPSVVASMSEDFESGTIENTKWDFVEASGVECSVVGGKLRIEGTRNGGGDWSNHDTWTNIESILHYGPGVEIEYKNSVGGFGTGYGSGISLFQDSRNHIDIGQTYDPGAGRNATLSRWGKINGAWLTGVTLDSRPIDSSTMHTFRVVYPENRVAEIYVDDVKVETYSFNLDHFSIRFFGHTRMNSDYIKAFFDDTTIEGTPSQGLPENGDPTEGDDANSLFYCEGSSCDVWIYLAVAIVSFGLIAVVWLIESRSRAQL
ncbi:MAG: hypothetical protein KAW09_10480 [Thermoplasmata archaeon]|nr:hypothetical protein [Thermoplasmata archaeon]